jgi:hypothetical protein
MAAVREVHAEHGIARLDQREVGRHVGLGSRMRLHVGVLRAKERLGTCNRGLLDDVDKLTAAVVPATRVPFGILVREDRAGGVENGAAHEVFRCDELEAAVLAVELVPGGVGDFRIELCKSAPHGGSRLGCHVVHLCPDY